MKINFVTQIFTKNMYVMFPVLYFMFYKYMMLNKSSFLKSSIIIILYYIIFMLHVTMTQNDLLYVTKFVQCYSYFTFCNNIFSVS